MLNFKKIIILTLIIVTAVASVIGQDDILRRVQGAGGRFGRPSMGSQGGDSLQHRTGYEDSITIHFRFLDSTRYQNFDSSITDFTNRFPLGWNEVNLGNLGTAAKNLEFSPSLNAGWDHGFHAYDANNFTLAQTKFYNTTRPYAEIGYLLGSQAEQMIHLMHTQNVLPNWNIAVQYRLINSYGFFTNQNTNHNNYRITSWYQSKNKRYQNFVVILGNKLQASENGGILQDTNYLDDPDYRDRSIIPVELGGDKVGRRNFFNINITTGTRYTNATYLLRQQYDLGQKDSIVTDSTVIPLFYPRLRLEHSLAYTTFNYRFADESPDSSYYASRYNMHDLPSDRVYLQDKWGVLLNDFSIYTFPDAKNPQQFLKTGAAIQNLSGHFDSMKVHKNYTNIFGHGEYRNKTKNQKWDIEAVGSFYFSGLNAGDYDAYISLKRLISKKLGSLQVGFQNVNRTPSFVFDPQSSFYLVTAPSDFKKENTAHFFGALEQPAIKMKLTGDYYLLTNYTYFNDYYKPDQFSSLFTVLRLAAEKQFHIGGGWNWRTWVVVQQRAGDGPVNLPLVLTRNQIAYDGSLGFKNLRMSTGLELRYFTPYHASGYSPLNGQFFYQDSVSVEMKRPELAAFLHFRIKTFTAYVRAENLNTVDFAAGGFTKNNILIPGYPYPGLQIRFGIFWDFIN